MYVYRDVMLDGRRAMYCTLTALRGTFMSLKKIEKEYSERMKFHYIYINKFAEVGACKREVDVQANNIRKRYTSNSEIS